MTEALAPGAIQLRIGVHTGTPLVTDEGYVGDDVHFAARVAAAGHGGQVVLSQATGALLDGHTLTDLGEHRLKDIEGAVSIFQLGTRLPAAQDDLEHEPAAAGELFRRAGGRGRRGARAARGRGAPCDADRARRLWQDPACARGGRRRSSREYKAGVFWVGLASLRDPALVTATIAQTIGARTASPSTSASARCCSSSTTSSR